MCRYLSRHLISEASITELTRTLRQITILQRRPRQESQRITGERTLSILARQTRIGESQGLFRRRIRILVRRSLAPITATTISRQPERLTQPGTGVKERVVGCSVGKASSLGTPTATAATAFGRRVMRRKRVKRTECAEMLV